MRCGNISFSDEPRELAHHRNAHRTLGALPSHSLLSSHTPALALAPAMLPYKSPPSSPISPPTSASSSSHAPWRTRFVLSASQSNPKVSLVGQGAHPSPVSEMANAAAAALAQGVQPELVDDGLGGTYFISRRGPGGHGSEKICVFKPRDEEPNAINNPKQQQQGSAALGAPGLKGGIRVGDAALNEWAGTHAPASPERLSSQTRHKAERLHPLTV